MAIVLPPPETIIISPRESDALNRLLHEAIEEYARAEEAAQRARARNVKLTGGNTVAVAGGFAAVYALLIAAAAAPLVQTLVEALTDTDTDVDVARRRRRKTYKCAAMILEIIGSVQTDSAEFSRSRALETKPEERRKARKFRSRA